MGFVGEYDPATRAAAVQMLLDGLLGGLSIVDAAARVREVHGVSRQRVAQWAREDGHVLRPSYAAMQAAEAEIDRLRRLVEQLEQALADHTGSGGHPGRGWGS